MGQCIAKLPHKTATCNTKTGLQVFARDDGTVDGYCFACSTYVRHPYGEPKQEAEIPKLPQKSPEEVQQEIDEISSYPTVDLKQRRLRAKYLEQLGIKTSLSEVDGKTPEAIHYPYYQGEKFLGYKNKLLKTKKIWSTGSLSGADLFNWHNAKKSGAKRLIITEGEDDVAAGLAILSLHSPEQYKKNIPAIVSLPRGASSANKVLDQFKKEIKSLFKEVVLCFDQDEPGQEAVRKALTIFPHALTVTLPDKDLNDCLINGNGQAAYNQITFNAAKPKNSRLVMGKEIHLAAKEPPKFGELSWPWEHINKITRGIRYGEVVYMGAGVKMGKSEILNSIASHFITEHNVKVFLAKPEESNKKSYKLMAGKVTGNIFHDPLVPFDEDAFEKAGEVLADKLVMVDMYQHIGWTTLKEDIITAANLGCKAIFIDPITNLTNGMNAADANTKLQEIAQDLSKMALDLNVVIFVFCHLKSNEGNISKDKRTAYYKENKFIGLGSCPHELGGDVTSDKFAGSRSMMRSCNLMIGIEGNKDNELPTEVKNIRNLKLLEDREFGETGVFPIYWNPVNQKYKEI